MQFDSETDERQTEIVTTRVCALVGSHAVLHHALKEFPSMFWTCEVGPLPQQKLVPAVVVANSGVYRMDWIASSAVLDAPCWSSRVDANLVVTRMSPPIQLMSAIIAMPVATR